MASPIFQMRLDPEQRARWVAAAGAEQSLADFIKECVEEKIARAVEPDAPRVLRPIAQPWLDLRAKWQEILDRESPTSPIVRRACEVLDYIDTQLARLAG